ncbi:cytochrome P450 [Spirillospora sp. NPDC048911]|uniref:cytochrome P450 n=1 Tax=Spirillospora sp. NPDC048911 TaxID=3364527 RepID=UPI003711C49A
MPQRRGALPISDTEVLNCPDTYARGVPYDCLDRLRGKTPVVWLDGRFAGEPGSWAVLRYTDVRRALSRPELFSPIPLETLHGPVVRGSAHDGMPIDTGGTAADDGGGAAAGTPIDMDPQAQALLSRIGQESADLITGVLNEMPETLRNTVAGGAYALVRHPEQYARLRAGRADETLLDSAVEEMLRWWTPVMQVRRLVRRSTKMGGVPLRTGEQVALWLTAANHDDEVYVQPGRFLPERFVSGSERHLSFGHGARVCLGGHLARVHLRAMILAILDRPGRLELAGEPVRLRSTARHGFEHLPVRWAPE